MKSFSSVTRSGVVGGVTRRMPFNQFFAEEYYEPIKTYKRPRTLQI